MTPKTIKKESNNDSTKLNTPKKMILKAPEMIRPKMIRVEVKSKPKKMIQKEQPEGLIYWQCNNQNIGKPRTSFPAALQKKKIDCARFALNTVLVNIDAQKLSSCEGIQIGLYRNTKRVQNVSKP